MDSIRSAHDGSWNPIRDELNQLWRAQRKEVGRRKLLRDDVISHAKQLDTVMTYLDGSHRIGKLGFMAFDKTKVEILSQQEDEET